MTCQALKKIKSTTYLEYFEQLENIYKVKYLPISLRAFKIKINFYHLLFVLYNQSNSLPVSKRINKKSYVL